MKRTQKKQRHYYAELCPYDLNTLSIDDCVLQFDSKKERDRWVAADPDDFNPERRIISLSEASASYKIEDFHNPDFCHEFDGHLVVGLRPSEIRSADLN